MLKKYLISMQVCYNKIGDSVGIVEGVVGATIGIKLVNGKLRPKKRGKVKIYLLFAFLGVVFILPLAWFIGKLVTGTFDVILFASAIICGSFLIYLLMISPYTQNPNNYDIEFKDENTLAGFKLYYKSKLVNVLYKVDKYGKIAFADNNNKLNCVSYADGSVMKKVDKYRIVNYFALWLTENDLVSKEVTFVFE